MGHNAKATWMILGAHVQDDRAELLSTLVKDGHELGNHGMHDRPAVKVSRTSFKRDAQTCQGLIENAGKSKFKWYRPSHALFTPYRKKWLLEQGFRLVIGSVYPHDAFDLAPFQFSYAPLLAWILRVKTAAGDVIVLHDRPWTAKVLELALPTLCDRFEVCTLTKLAETCESTGKKQS